MVAALRDDEHIALHVLGEHEPAAAVLLALHAADAQPAPLAERVVHQPVVTADDAPLRRAHLTRLRGQELLQKRLEAPLADEAHAGGILLPAGNQPGLRGDFAHLCLGHAADREHGLFERALAEHVEEVTLILVRVCAAKELTLSARLAQAAEVPGRHRIRAELQGVIKKRLELDLPVAQHVRVGRAPAPVLVKKVGKHAVVVFAHKIDRVIWDADRVAHAAHVGPVGLAGAHAALVLLLPVLHEHADDLMPRPLEQQRGDGGIHPAGHAHDDSRHLFFFSFTGLPPMRKAAHPLPQACPASHSRWAAPR